MNGLVVLLTCLEKKRHKEIAKKGPDRSGGLSVARPPGLSNDFLDTIPAKPLECGKSLLRLRAIMEAFRENEGILKCKRSSLA